MSTYKRQAGVSMLGILVIVCLFSFFLTVTLRLGPAYMEGRKVRAAVEQVVETANASQSLRDVTRRIESVFNTNMVEGLDPRDVKVYRENEVIIVDASYETRTNVFKGVDAVLVFDDLKYEVD